MGTEQSDQIPKLWERFEQAVLAVDQIIWLAPVYAKALSVGISELVNFIDETEVEDIERIFGVDFGSDPDIKEHTDVMEEALMEILGDRDTLGFLVQVSRPSALVGQMNGKVDPTDTEYSWGSCRIEWIYTDVLDQSIIELANKAFAR